MYFDNIPERPACASVYDGRDEISLVDDAKHRGQSIYLEMDERIPCKNLACVACAATMC